MEHGDRVRFTIHWPVEHEEVGVIQPVFPWDDVADDDVKVEVDSPMSYETVIPEEDVIEVIDQ